MIGIALFFINIWMTISVCSGAWWRYIVTFLLLYAGSSMLSFGFNKESVPSIGTEYRALDRSATKIAEVYAEMGHTDKATERLSQASQSFVLYATTRCVAHGSPPTRPTNHLPIALDGYRKRRSPPRVSPLAL